MSIETKWLIGLLLLMGIGSLLTGIMGGSDSPIDSLTEAASRFTNSFTNYEVKGLGEVVLSGGSFLFAFAGFLGMCVYWNFPFFEGFRWLQGILVLINIAIIGKVLFDLFRALKPFGG